MPGKSGFLDNPKDRSSLILGKPDTYVSTYTASHANRLEYFVYREI